MKAERWETMVDKVAFWDSCERNKLVNMEDAVILLRRQHAAAVRLVKKIRDRATVSQFIISSQCAAYREACNDILAELAKQKDK